MGSNRKYLMEKICKYHSNKDSFIYFDSKQKGDLTEKVN